MCVQGARWVQQEILDEYADEELKAYVVWLPMINGDERERWKPELIDDPRVRHFWNEDQAVGRWFTKQMPSCETLGAVAWDAYYLFDGTADWVDAPAPVLVCGTPVYKKTEPLQDAMAALFKSDTVNED